MSDTKRILVVDDESHRLDTIRRGLFLFGYDSQGAICADDAIALLLGTEGATFDLVITDLTMPGRSGINLIEQIRKTKLDLPIIVITGLAATDEVKWVLKRCLPILQKPFEPYGLNQLIEEQLGQPTR